MIELTAEQRRLVLVDEIKHQLTVMKQYLSKEDTDAYLHILERRASLLEYEQIVREWKAAWG